MYVSYLLDKENGMYPNAVRHPSLNLSPQNFVPAAPQYTDFTGYHHHHHHHHVPGFNDANQTTAAYPPPPPPAPTRDDWTPYGPSAQNSSSNPGQISFGPPDFPPSNLQPSALLHPSISSSSSSVAPLSPSEQRRNPYEWMRRSAAPPSNPGGKTRTKDKYRVVYTDHQRLELEKEFHYSRYITIRRKAELATTLSLSERQVKIWFQNRRAKERKINKKKLQQPQASTTTPTPPSSNISNISSSSSAGLVSSSMPMTIKEEY
ncbi:homeobox protein CDX-1 [Silurus asotus]|uniref:Homeobox protein CDX-1 n=1 Tax=Silurus asotus TaxID=30991 RepID=A0AAD5ABQ0_SILAS|nr:homeobox protein CDX-1 [Silurus asotus]